MTQPETSPAPLASRPETSPIADLSYRHYDGPLHTRAHRWWTVALAGIRPVIRKWWFWILLFLSSGPYVFWGFMLFLQSRFGTEINRLVFQNPEGQRFGSVFYGAYQGSLFWLMVLALVMAAPSIAADNRTNALQVYLSKPVTKLDYLLGKWASVMIVIAAAVLLPSLALFGYCALSFWSQGFFRQEPWLFFRIIASALVTAAGFSFVLVGISAWCRSTMIAAAVGAGVYLGSQMASRILWVVLHFRDLAAGQMGAGVLVQHASVGGVISGLVWNIYGVSQRVPMVRGGTFNVTELHPPDLWIMLVSYLALVGLGAILAYVRVRAVEVVTS